MLLETSQRVFERLLAAKHSIVFCESCTAGLAASMLGRFPGASRILTGSMVVYQTQTKTDWLGVDPSILNSAEIGPVSDCVTKQLAERVLKASKSATIAAAVTGHLGPSASIVEYDSKRLDGNESLESQSNAIDGTVYVATVTRNSTATVRRFQLGSPTPTSTEDHVARYNRQVEATLLVYQQLLGMLDMVN